MRRNSRRIDLGQPGRQPEQGKPDQRDQGGQRNSSQHDAHQRHVEATPGDCHASLEANCHHQIQRKKLGDGFRHGQIRPGERCPQAERKKQHHR
jgi:hypothetical protein